MSLIIDVSKLLRDFLAKRLHYPERNDDGEGFHSAQQNATRVADAQACYKAMYYARPDACNLRDIHMFDTLMRLLEAKGRYSKAIVRAHNS